MKRIDSVVSELCEEVDFYKREAAYWKNKYETEIRNQAEESALRLKQTQKSIGQALLFAMSIKDDPNGDLRIAKEDRMILAEKFNNND